MQEWYQSDGKPRFIARRLGIAVSQLPYEYDWAQSLYDTIDSEIVFSHRNSFDLLRNSKNQNLKYENSLQPTIHDR